MKGGEIGCYSYYFYRFSTDCSGLFDQVDHNYQENKIVACHFHRHYSDDY